MRKLALPLLVALAAACSHRKPVPPPAPIPVDPPEVAFEGARLEELGFTQTRMTFRTRVDNPNPFPLSVSRVRFTVLLEGSPAAQGEVETSFAIPAAAPDGARGTGSVSFPVAIRFGAVPGFARVMATRREAAYAFTGTMAFHTPHGVVEFPFQGGGVMGVPKMPEVRVARLQLRSASPTEVVLELQVKVANANPFPLPSASLDYALLVSRKEVARAVGRLEFPVAPGESTELNLPIRISPLKAGKAAARFLLPFASLKVELKGGLDFDGVPIPMDLEADVLPKG